MEWPENYESAREQIYGAFRETVDRGQKLFAMALDAVHGRGIPPVGVTRDMEQAQDESKKRIDRLIVYALVNFLSPPGDVRRYVAIVRSGADLERVGDNSVQIIVAMREAHLQKVALPEPDIQAISGLVQSLLTASVETLLKEQFERIEANRQLEDRIDEEYKQLTQEVLQIMVTEPAMIQGALTLLNVVRRLERIADHAGNIVEHYISIVKEEE